MGDNMTAEGIASSIRATMAALEAKYRQLEKRHRDADVEADNLRAAMLEAIQQQQEALRRHDAPEVKRLERAIKSMDAELGRQEAIKSKAEKDAGAVRAEYAGCQKALQTPESIPYKCPECGATLKPTAPKKLPKGRRAATYDCGGCDVIYGVSWGAAGGDVAVQAA
jgi:DNA repair exonuclease SbcCD ATPase subunit